MQLRILVLALAAALVFAGCRVSVDDEDETVTAVTLQGTWVGACAPDSANNESEKETAIFGTTSLSWGMTLYWEDQTCSAAAASAYMEFTGTYAEDTPTTSSYPGIAGSFSNAVFTPLTDAAATQFNTMDSGLGLCGYTDWVANTAKDVSTKINLSNDCGGPPIDETWYDIYSIQGDRLYFGLESDSNTRPTTLDTSSYLTKQ